MVSIFLAMAIKDKNILIRGPRDRIRDFVHIDDVINCIYKSTSRKNGRNYESLNVGTGRSVKVYELIDRIVSLTGAKYKYLDYRTPEDQDACTADVRKSQSMLEFVCEKNINDKLIDMTKWAKEEFLNASRLHT